MADEMIDPELVSKLSGELMDKFYWKALELIKPIAAEHGDFVAANVLTNALASTAALQMGNHLKFLGAIKTDEEFQKYCESMTGDILKAFIGPNARS